MNDEQRTSEQLVCLPLLRASTAPGMQRGESWAHGEVLSQL